MKRNLFILLALGFLSALTPQLSPVFAQGTAFSYDGRLQDNGGPANGTYNFTFSLYTDSSGGSPVAGPVVTNGVGVTNGLFIVQIDFGAGVWNGQTNWLEIAVETNTGNSFSTLSPRQQVTPTPYAIFATTSGSLSGTLPLAQLPAVVVTNGASGINLTGAFSGNGGGLTNVPAYWQTVSGTSQTASANYAYLLTNNFQSTVTLPASPNVGDIVTVSGTGANGWQVVPNAGQTIPGTAAAAGVNWTAQNSTSSAVWTSVASSADGSKLVAVAYQGQIYTSGDSGVTWTPQNSGILNWQAVASSTDGTKLAAAVIGGQIYTSGDSGVTWTQQNGAPSVFWDSMASSSDGVKLVAVVGYEYNGQIYTSSDSGVTWTAQNGAPPEYWPSVASSADGTKLAAVAYGGQIYTSGDSGVTWTAQNSGTQYWTCVASSADGSKLAAAVADGQIYTSGDSGVTWTPQPGAPQAGWFSIASSADGSKLVAVVEEGQIYTSSDSGVTWSAQNSSVQDWMSVASSADGSKLVAVSPYAPIYTSDQATAFHGAPNTAVQFQYIGGGVWQPLGQAAGQIVGTIPLAQLPAAVVTNGASGVNLVGAFSGNGGGLTNVPAFWQTVSSTSQAASANYAYLLTNNSLSTVTLPASPNVGDIVTVSGVGAGSWLVAANAGQTIPGSTMIPAGVIWTAQNGAPMESWKAVASSSDGTELVASAVSSPMYTSSDSGVTWTAQNSGSVGALCVASSADGTKLVAGNAEIYTSDDSGVTWTERYLSTSLQIISIASSADGTKLAAVDNDQAKIYTSSDSGVTWTAQNNSPAAAWSIASSADGSKLVVGGQGSGIYTSSDSGVTWTVQNGAPQVWWHDVASSSDGTKLVAARYGGQIYTSSDSGVTWTAQNSSSQPWWSVASSADGTKLEAVSGGAGGQIYTSTDSGVTWTAQASSSSGWLSVASSADGSKLVAAAAGGQIYTSDQTTAFSGPPNTAVQFQYIGGGVWQPLGQLADLLAGGVTTNLVVTVPTGTKTLYFTNGVLRAVQ